MERLNAQRDALAGRIDNTHGRSSNLALAAMQAGPTIWPPDSAPCAVPAWSSPSPTRNATPTAASPRRGPRRSGGAPAGRPGRAQRCGAPVPVAVQMQDQRLIATSAPLRRKHAAAQRPHHSPPYTVTAIGDVAAMQGRTGRRSPGDALQTICGPVRAGLHRGCPRRCPGCRIRRADSHALRAARQADPVLNPPGSLGRCASWSSTTTTASCSTWSSIWGSWAWLPRSGATTTTAWPTPKRWRDGTTGCCSPRPGTPERAGATIPMVRASAATGTPLLGVCLGHQAIGVAFGATVDRAPGIAARQDQHRLPRMSECCTAFRIHSPATRYHSPTILPETVPAELRGHRAHAQRRDHGCAAHRTAIHGVQFHPESILTGGHRMLANWLAVCGAAPDENLVRRLERRDR